MFYSCENAFREKPDTSHREISVYCTPREHDNLITPYYPICVPLFVKWSLTSGWEQKKILNFKL